MADRDRPTPRDPLPAVRGKVPSRPDDAPGLRDTLDDAERAKREAVSALRRVGAQRAQIEERRQTPRGLPRPRQDTLRDAVPPPPNVASSPHGSPQSFPPPISDQRHRTPESGTPAQGDRRPPIPVLVEQTPSSRAPSRGHWRKLGYKLGTAIVAALVLVIGALGLWAASAINAKREAIEAQQAEKKKAEGREEKWRQWANVAAWILDCRDRRDVATGEMLRPDPQKMGAGRKLEAWKNDCPTQLPPPP